MPILGAASPFRLGLAYCVAKWWRDEPDGQAALRSLQQEVQEKELAGHYLSLLREGPDPLKAATQTTQGAAP